MIKEENRKWWILAAMTTSISMIFVDVTVLPVVLPTLKREFNISELSLQWVINAYTLALTVLVLAGGRLGDMLGLRKSFCIGLAFFSFASALCGLSPSPEWLIANRALQGIGGAFMIPATQGIIFHHFPPHQRGKAIGLFVSIGSIFLALGPLVGGFLTQYLSWHFVFWINLPIALIGFCLTMLTTPPMQGTKERFDFWGWIAICIGISSIVVALMQSQLWGWGSLRTLALLSFGAAVLFTLYHFRRRAPLSIIDFALIKQHSFIGGSGCIFIAQFILIVTVFWAIYFQNILGLDPSQAGILTFASNLPVLFGAPMGGFLVDRYGPRLPVITGLFLILFSLCWFMLFSVHENLWHLLPTLLPFGLGVPMIFTPSSVALFHEVAPEKRGVASGLNATFRQLGATLAMAFFGTFFSTMQSHVVSTELSKDPQTAILDPEIISGLLAKTPLALKTVKQLSPTDAQLAWEAAKTAFITAFNFINFSAACVAVIGLFFARKFLKDKPIH